MLKSVGVIPFILLNLNNTSKFLDNSFLKEENFYYESKELIVRGNIENLDSSTYLKDKPNKDLLIFDYESKIDDEYYGFFYDFESNKTFYLETNSTDLTNLRDDLKTFYLESNSKKSVNEIDLASTTDDSLFKEIKSNTISKIEKPYGRMTFTYSLKEYEYNTISSLYLFEVKQYFISGANCIENFEKDYGKYYNDSEFVHIEALQNEAQMGYDDIVKSGVPKFKDAYPVTKPTTVTVSSSYQIGVNFGYSFRNGFSSKSITLEKEDNYGASINYGYSKSYTTTNPRLTSQPGEDMCEYQWNYFYDNGVDAATNYQVLGYMFECNRYQNKIDTHNKFDIVLTAKASFSTLHRFEVHDVNFRKVI